MQFTSWFFILFVLAITGIYYAIPKGQRFILLMSSFIFVIWLDFRYALILVGVFSIEWVVLRAMHGSKGAHKSFWAFLGLLSSVGLLIWIRYRIFIETLLVEFLPQWPITPLGFDFETGIVSLGLSFFTFKLISTFIDSYRGKIPQPVTLVSWLTHLFYFPEFLAGPIQRFGHFRQEIQAPKVFKVSDFWIGMNRIIIGIFKKTIIADSIALYVNRVYADYLAFSSLNVLLAMFLYAFQLYYDFSGYTDIAVGISRWFGLNIPENFNLPYLAISVKNFWRRWHVTLSTWFRDYVYIPLGGSRGGFLRTSINVIAVFVLTGVWHGAGWNYLVWGLIHGTFIVLENYLVYLKQRQKWEWLEDITGLRLIRWFVTFNVLVVAWVFFRIPSVKQACHLIQYSLSGIGQISEIPWLPILLLAGWGLVYLINNFISRQPKLLVYQHPIKAVELAICLMGIILLTQSTPNDFIYFGF